MSFTAFVGATQLASETLTVKQCPVCSIIYAMPQSRANKCQETGDSWYCPNGHSLIFTTTKVQEKEREIERLKSSLESARERADYHQNNALSEQRKRYALKGVLTKTKKRAANGVCPCCNRYFSNVHRHMQTKHPEHGKAE